MNIQVASICKNEEVMIRPWLEHLLALDNITDIYLNDTGSTDATIDYIKSYNDSRIHLYESKFSNFSDSRNFILSKLNKPEWFIQLDIDELFNCNYKDAFDLLDRKDKQQKIIHIPHIKLFDFNKIWFHKPPTTPSYDNNEMKYSVEKDTITLYHGSVQGIYKNKLHERYIINGNYDRMFFSLLNKMSLSDLSDLQDDFYCIHYSKAKLHEEARQTGKSFEYCVGKKRREYRLLKPFVTNGKLYDREWALKATESDIEELGKNQMIQFINVEGHVFPETNFDVYDLNNDYIKKYFSKE